MDTIKTYAEIYMLLGKPQVIRIILHVHHEHVETDSTAKYNTKN